MKVTKINGMGNYGHFVDDVDFTNMSEDQMEEIRQLHLKGLVTIFRNNNLPRDMYRGWVERFGNIRYIGTSVHYEHKYGVKTQTDLYKLYKRGKLDPIDVWRLEIREHMTDQTETGEIYRINGEKDENGNYRGTFGVGDVGWHSNESSLLRFVPGVALFGYENMTKSATGFAQTADYYESLPDSIRSEFDEMVVVYKYKAGDMNHLEVEDYKFSERMKVAFCPVDGAEVPLVITSPGGIRALHYPKQNLWKIKGMTEEESKKIFNLIESNILSDQNIYDHWYQQDNDMLLFDNSITLHRRVGSQEKRLGYRLQFDYKNTEEWCPYNQSPYREMYLRGEKVAFNC